MAVCVLQDSARQCKDEEAVVVVWLPWLISHSIETIWVTLIWGPLHAVYNTLYSLYCTVTWGHGTLEKYILCSKH